MSDEKAPAPAEGAEGEAKPKKGPNKMLLPLVVLLMTVAGGVVGAMVVAPTLVARSHKTAGLADSTEAEGDKKEGEHGEGKGGERGPMFKIDNLIVNPAGSQGSRFLMVSVAVETSDAKLEEELRAREPQIRDVVISMLERQSMESLSQPGIRDTLKIQLSDTISVIAGTRSKLKVFLPQFVIQ